MFSSLMPKSLLKLLHDDRVSGFGKYLFNLKISHINEGHVFLLDAIRALLNYADESDEIYKLMMDIC